MFVTFLTGFAVTAGIISAVIAWISVLVWLIENCESVWPGLLWMIITFSIIGGIVAILEQTGV